MGLAIRCDCWEVHFRAGSYTYFRHFRQYLAALVAIDLPAMQGHGGTTAWQEDTPLQLFLRHSDCDGQLTPEECSALLGEWGELFMDDSRLRARVAAARQRATLPNIRDLDASLKQWHEAFGHCRESDCNLQFG